MPVKTSEYCPRHAHGAPSAAASVDTPAPDAPAADKSGDILAAVSDLRDQGFADVQISARLGLTAAEFRAAVRVARLPAHGSSERWYRGCRCRKCSEAVRNDPLVIRVGELRTDGRTVKEISDELGILPHQAERAGRASGARKGGPHGSPERWRAGCQCEACAAAAPESDPVATVTAKRPNIGVQDRTGLNGLSRERASGAAQVAAHPADPLGKKSPARKRRRHGTPVRWRAGCRCRACVTAIRKDPLVIEVAELRNTGLAYKEIAAQLGIHVPKAQEAGFAAGFKGPVGGPTSMAPPQCSWPSCGSPALTGIHCAFHQDWAKHDFDPAHPATRDDFPSALRATVILKAVELMIEGSSYEAVGQRLAISTATITKLCRDAGFTEAHQRSKAPEPSGNVWHRGEEWNTLVGSAEELLGEGLNAAQIAKRLGIRVATAAQAIRASGEACFFHGVPAKWHAGCRCDTCLQAMSNDPFITAVAERRSRKVAYKEIAAELGATLPKVQQAGREANACGLVDSFRVGREAVKSTRSSEPLDGFTAEAWTELVDAVGKLRETGLRPAAIGRQLGVSTAVVRHAQGLVAAGPAEPPAPLEGRELPSQFALDEAGASWGIPLDAYAELTTPTDVSPEAHQTTQDDPADLAPTVGKEP